jgi:hypothetical protein
MPFNQVVSTADAMPLNQVVSTADAKTLSQETRSVERVAAPLILCDGTTRIARSQLVNDAGLSIEEDRFAFSNELAWRPQPRGVPPVDGFPHHLDDGGYLSDGQQHTDARREWHGKKRFLSINRGLCIPSYTLKLTDHDDSESVLLPCFLTPNSKGLLRNELSSNGEFEVDTDVHKLYPWDDITVNNFTRKRALLDEEHGKQTEFPGDVPRQASVPSLAR